MIAALVKKVEVRSFSERFYDIFSILMVVTFCLLPLVISLPYRVNLYVSWEGAYRMYLGQLPYRDFGMPIGYAYWLIPFLFFKALGPYMSSLLWAQAFINIFSALLIRDILKVLGANKPVVFFALLTYSLSFILINFWPWYNHTVFFYELIAICMILRYVFVRRRILYLLGASLSTCLALLTKQDGGGLTLVMLGVLFVLHYLYERDNKGAIYLILSFIAWFFILFVPFFSYEFDYWFNYGQAPHYSRISGYNFMKDWFEGSNWIKGYLLIIMLFLAINIRNLKQSISNKKFVFFILLSLGILVQASIIQVTSFSPPTGNLYFHTFAIALIFYLLQSEIRFESVVLTLVFTFLIGFWQSQNLWKYSSKVFSKVVPSLFSPPPKNVVSKGNWASGLDSPSKPVQWKPSSLVTLSGMRLPENTMAGIDEILNLNLSKDGELQVLNMSNLTFLANELHYIPTAGIDFPLWYHKGVALFEREVDMLCQKVHSSSYDLILFEDMPNVDNYFPYEVRQCALENYKKVNKFISPTGYTSDSVEVYIRKRPLEP
ncbi:MAG: hypothetical protein AAF519_15255 [Bacteroidota bacterium]